ncbi:hypothetical protein MTR67_043338 [Solanum verrucosum]|uniref:Uncharacterized protein n=1 Tax=Solanum verrucosum TaxID=315347 RepID=A0AAF0ZU74_SOLVR|nr:hypothetical protein MTR67_043338 [Solanum verrucosum]
MDNEIQKLKTNEDNLKSKASQQHDYKNAELRRPEDGKNPELKGDDGKLLKTHNVCLNTAADISDSMAKQEAKARKPFRGVNKVEALIRRKYPLKYDGISMDSVDNEIQKLKTNEDNLKSKASQQHDYKNAELRRSENEKNPELKGDDGKLLKTHNLPVPTKNGISMDSVDNEIQKLKTNEDNLKSKASQQHDYKNAELRRPENEKNPELKGDDGKLLKTHNLPVPTKNGISMDSVDNEIQKLKTNEDNLKSKASQQHDYKNAELRRPENEKNPELKGDDGKLLKTHNVCLNTAADSMAKQEAKARKPFRGVNKVEALIRRKYPLKYDASSDRKT